MDTRRDFGLEQGRDLHSLRMECIRMGMAIDNWQETKKLKQISTEDLSFVCEGHQLRKEGWGLWRSLVERGKHGGQVGRGS